MFRLLKRKRNERAIVMKYLDDIDKQTKMLIEKNQKDLDLWRNLQNQNYIKVTED